MRKQKLSSMTKLLYWTALNCTGVTKWPVDVTFKHYTTQNIASYTCSYTQQNKGFIGAKSANSCFALKDHISIRQYDNDKQKKCMSLHAWKTQTEGTT